MLGLKDATSEYIERGSDLTQFFEVGDIVVCKITNVTSQRLIDVSTRGPGLIKLTGGRLLRVNPCKVPRIIGKHGSMVSMIKQATECRLVVGQNGTVWVNGAPDKELITVKAIKMIEENSHISGLTDKVKSFLEKETGTTITVAVLGE